MKQVKRFLRPISLFLSMLILLISCDAPDQYVIDNTTANKLITNNYTGEELFRSIIFGDGELTELLPALAAISQINNLSEEALDDYRDYQNQAIQYLLEQDELYFEKFKEKMYSQSPYIISEELNKTVTDIAPWVNEKLQEEEIGLTIEDINDGNYGEFGSFFNDNDLSNLDFDNYPQNFGIVWVAVVLVVAAAAVWVAVISAVVVVAGDTLSASNITQEAITIQLAEYLIPTSEF